MQFYKSPNGEVFAYASAKEREDLGEEDLVEMTAEEIQNHCNPKPTNDQLAYEARAKRDALLAETDWVVIRHRDEIEEGVKTTLIPDQYSSIQAYRRDLRDITEQSRFPENINWPISPNA